MVENEEIRTFKCLLYVCNETFRKVLDDPLFQEPLKLYDECTKESYFLLEKYYQGIEIEITDQNCVEFLSICVCYNEERIIKKIIDYIICHLNANIIIDLLSKKQILRSDCLIELKEEYEDFIKNENYKLIHKDFMNYISIENLKYLFSLGIMFNGSEIHLLRLLIDYYKCNIEYFNEKEKEELKNIVEGCKFDVKTFNALDEEEKETINYLKISITGNEIEKYSIRYYSIPEIESDFFYKFLIHYYPEDEVQKITFNSIIIIIIIISIDSHLISLKEEKEIEDDIEKLLNENNIKLIMLVLQLQDALYMKYDITEYNKIFDLLLENYKLADDEEKHLLLLKYVIRFVSPKIYYSTNETLFNKIKDSCGVEGLFYLTRDKKIIGENRFNLLMDYIHRFRFDENECKILDSIIKDEKTKKMIKCIKKYHFIIIDHELELITYFEDKKDRYYSYSDYNAKFLSGDKVFLKPTIKDIIDVEDMTIEPSILYIIIIILELPNGLSFDTKTGIISGIASEDCDKRFTIKIRNYLNEKQATIKLNIFSIHFDIRECDDNIKLDSSMKTITTKSSYKKDCFLNIKLESGIYHFLFLINANDFSIGANDVYNKYDKKKFSWDNNNQINGENGIINSVTAGYSKYYVEKINVENNEYEVIFDMNKRTFNIKDKNGKIHTIITDFKGYLTPYVSIKNGNCQLLKSWIE